MNDYEEIAKDLKLFWHEKYRLDDERYTQVSAYIFDEEDRLLIVRNDKTWTIPGGHPEEGETAIESLEREIMEEACVRVKDIEYLGAVEVIDKGDKYFQLRYTAKVDEVLSFISEFEISERKFVKLEELNKYITWSSGKTFKAQIASAKKQVNKE